GSLAFMDSPVFLDLPLNAGGEKNPRNLILQYLLQQLSLDIFESSFDVLPKDNILSVFVVMLGHESMGLRLVLGLVSGWFEGMLEDDLEDKQEDDLKVKLEDGLEGKLEYVLEAQKNARGYYFVLNCGPGIPRVVSVAAVATAIVTDNAHLGHKRRRRLFFKSSPFSESPR
ncbi:hypothetical protein BGZ79_008148, partial [Entomortierella chlamydospora]